MALLFVCSDTQYDLNVKSDDDVRLHIRVQNFTASSNQDSSAPVVLKNTVIFLVINELRRSMKIIDPKSTFT